MARRGGKRAEGSPVTERAARRRVAITGIGLVTPVGNDVQATWSALDSVKNGAAEITLFDASGFPTRIAAEVKGFDERVITAPRKFLTLDQKWTEAPELGILADVFEQDMENLPFVQEGLHASKNREVQLGNYQEIRIRQFQDTLMKYINGELGGWKDK